MMFFREREEILRVQKQSEVLGFHVKVKAVYAAQVDNESGMTVNLKDVDDWMKEVSAKLPVFKSTQEILKFYYENLSRLSSQLVRVELTRGTSHFEFDGQKITYVYDLKSWFKESQTWMQRRVKIYSVKPLSKSWRKKFSGRKWSDPAVLAKKLKKKVDSVGKIEVQNREWSGWLGF